MRNNIRLAITGSSGYLAQELLKKLADDACVEFVLGLDVVPRKTAIPKPNYRFVFCDVRSAFLPALLKEHRINTVLHLAWMFNPKHDQRPVYAVDVLGSQNVFSACQIAGVKRIIYTSSTTAYGPCPDNPIYCVSENYPRRGHPSYQYSRNKEIVDATALQFMTDNPNVEFTLFRPCIVMGPHTDNIVTYVMKLPAMFRIWGYNPIMQFVGEEDIRNVLHQAITAERAHGVYNVSGDGLISYDRLCRLVKLYLGKPIITLPAAILYPSVNLLWKLHILRFPPGLLDFIRYNWVASNDKLKKEFGFAPKQKTEDALLSYLSTQC